MKRVFGNIPIYWINLNRSTDRRNNMQNQLGNHVKHQRIEAIDGTIETQFLQKYKITNPNTSMSSSLIAVVCSHIKAIKKALDEKLPYVIILEDKCNFFYVQHFNHTVNDIINIANTKDKNWDIIMLYTCPIYDDFADYEKKGLQIYRRTNIYYGSNYLINRSGMQKLINLFKSDGTTFDFTNISNFKSPEDILYNHVNTYAINCPFFYCYWPYTTFSNYFKNVDNKPMKLKAHQYQISVRDKIINYYEKKKQKIAKTSVPLRQIIVQGLESSIYRPN